MYDASSRVAPKLDPSQFTTSFQAYYYRVLEILAQVVLPGYVGHRAQGHLIDVDAQLYGRIQIPCRHPSP